MKDITGAEGVAEPIKRKIHILSTMQAGENLGKEIGQLRKLILQITNVKPVLVMNAYKISRITSIAAQVRKNIQMIKYFPPDCTGLCAIGSAELHRSLIKNGIKTKLAVWNSTDEGHCYLINGKFVIDITATQFSGFEKVKVLIKSHSELKKLAPYWQLTKSFDNVATMRKFLKSTGWCSEQLPTAKGRFKI